MSKSSDDPSGDELVPRSDAELETALQAWHAEREQRVVQLRRDARAAFSAMEGWQRVQSQDDWTQITEQARADYDAGRFLLERLGAERFLEPALMAVLLQLRRGLVGPDGGTASEAMLADLAVTSYYNTLRIQQWIGDLALAIEHEFFGQESPTARFEAQYGKATGLVVEEQLRRLGEQLLPLHERASRMTLRTLKALAELQRGPAPSVAIGQAEQVNVGTQQVNLAPQTSSNGGATPTPKRPRRRRPES
jgi:hypothetical protein